MTASADPQRIVRRPHYASIFAAVALFFLSLLLFWPGFAEYDTIVQYQEILSRTYTDWHPPIMARLWALFSFAGPTTAPLLVLQLAGYWAGLGLLGCAVSRGKALILLAIGASPLMLGWLAVVVKDSQLVGSLTLTVGIIGAYRLRRRAIPVFAQIIAISCLVYATLVRANAVFSTVPLAMLLVPRPRHEFARFATMIMAIPLVLLLSQPVNHLLLGASDSGVRSSQPIYDLSAIAVRTHIPSKGVSPQAVAALEAHHCVKPLFWDSLGENPACAAAIQYWDRMPLGQLYGEFGRAVVTHPVAYIAHRLSHLNSTDRWLVPFHWPLAAPPQRSEPNVIGFPNPSSLAVQWERMTGWMAETPLAWPVLWIVAAVWGLWNALRQPEGASRDLAFALFLSALFQEASFAVISISSDLRYHLWVMLAVAIGWVILWRSGMPVRGKKAALLAMLLLVLSGTAARLMLPPPPARYQDLMS
jgi:hypothetical protein